MSEWLGWVDLTLDLFISWMGKRKNQRRFTSIQEAFEAWLKEEGFDTVGDSYTFAVQIILVYLSRCVADPAYGTVEIRAHGQYRQTKVVVPVIATEPFERNETETYWEFLTEENFHRMYQDWLQSRSSS